MMRICKFIIIALIFSGCAYKSGGKEPIVNRYSCLTKQDSYISVSFPYSTKEFIGKTKKEIRNLFGEPKRVQLSSAGFLDAESWIYYPADTNNFIAIIFVFAGDKVKECSYHSVI